MSTLYLGAAASLISNHSFCRLTARHLLLVSSFVFHADEMVRFKSGGLVLCNRSCSRDRAAARIACFVQCLEGFVGLGAIQRGFD